MASTKSSVAPNNSKTCFDGTTQLMLNEDIILLPLPTDDPQDPLNIAKWQKVGITAILILYSVTTFSSIFSMGALFVYFIPGYQKAGKTMTQISGLITYPNLFLGVGNLFSMPLVAAVGRRPVLLASNVLLLVAMTLCATNQSFEWHLGARCLAGFAGAQAEALVPLIIQDIWFLHQRSRAIQTWTSAQTIFNSTLTIVSSYMVASYGWRSWYWLFVALACLSLLLVTFVVPETSYERPESAFGVKRNASCSTTVTSFGADTKSMTVTETPLPIKPLTTADSRVLDRTNHRSRSIRTDMRVFVQPQKYSAIVQNWRDMLRTITFPQVLFFAIMNGTFLAIDIGISTTYGTALTSAPYNWRETSIALLQVGQIIVALIALPLLGTASDWLVRRLARHRQGVHEPEHRLPTLLPPLLLMTVLTALYGQALARPEQFHWIAIVLAVDCWLLLLYAANTCAMTYLLDAHPTHSGAILVNLCVWRGLVGFGVSYSTSDYIEQIGAARLFGVYAGVLAAFGLGTVLLFVYGRRLRAWVATWSATA